MRIVAVWIGMLVAGLFICFEVLDLDHMESRSGAGGIVLLVLAAAAVAAGLITRSMRGPKQREPGVGQSLD